MIADASTLVAGLAGSAATLAVGFGVHVLTRRSEAARQRRDQRAAAYVSMLVVVDHVLASADAVAPIEGDFGSLREEFDMGAAERSRIGAEIRAHGTSPIRTNFARFLAAHDELQKWAMHIFEVHGLPPEDGVPIAADYGADAIAELRQELRAIALHLEAAVRRELHGGEQGD